MDPLSLGSVQVDDLSEPITVIYALQRGLGYLLRLQPRQTHGAHLLFGRVPGPRLVRRHAHHGVLVKGGRNGRGRNGIDADPGAKRAASKRELCGSRLRSAIGSDARIRLERRRRSNVDDVGVLDGVCVALPEADGLVRRVDGGRQVDGDGVADLLGVDGQKRRAQEARVVDEDREARELVRGELEEAVDVVGFGEIAGDEVGDLLAERGVDVDDGLLARGDVNVAQDNLVIARREELGHGEADALGGTSDYRDLGR